MYKDRSASVRTPDTLENSIPSASNPHSAGKIGSNRCPNDFISEIMDPSLPDFGAARRPVAKTRLWEQYVPMDVRTSNPYFVSQSCRMSQEVTRETPLRFISADSASATEEACPEFGYTYPFFSFGQMPISRKNARVSSTVNCFKISCTSPRSP